MVTVDVSEHYRVVVRRGAGGRKPYIWEIKDKVAEIVIQASEGTFISLEEAHDRGLEVLRRLPAPTARG
jgi:hypothetical protein